MLFIVMEQLCLGRVTPLPIKTSIGHSYVVVVVDTLGITKRQRPIIVWPDQRSPNTTNSVKVLLIRFIEILTLSYRNPFPQSIFLGPETPGSRNETHH